MLKNLIILISLCIGLTSCFEKDTMVPPHEPGDVIVGIIPMTMYYTNQVYYNLENSEISSINNRSAFDLNFECLDTSTVIRLNTANFALATLSDNTNILDDIDTSGLTWYFDGSSGDLDSLALKNWISINNDDTTYNNKVWLINRGINSSGIQLGLMKLKLNKYEQGSFYFTYASIDNSNIVEAKVSKNNEFIYTQYSFETDTIEQYEPEISNWDLLFTQYTTMLFTTEGDAYPYLVTGVLQQYGIVSVALDTNLVFNDITIADTANMEFSKNFDKIGYDWKELIGDVNTGDITYEVRLNYNYIIKDNSSFFYKLRFINFYNPDTGEKGFPTFEYQRL